MSACISNWDIGSKWVPLHSMVLFTLSDAKHQWKESQTQNQLLTFNGPLAIANIKGSNHRRKYNVVMNKAFPPLSDCDVVDISATNDYH